LGKTEEESVRGTRRRLSMGGTGELLGERGNEKSRRGYERQDQGMRKVDDEEISRGFAVVDVCKPKRKCLG
jgi:hypothetical protein